jgi:hypothetical protein
LIVSVPSRLSVCGVPANRDATSTNVWRDVDNTNGGRKMNSRISAWVRGALILPLRVTLMIEVQEEETEVGNDPLLQLRRIN